MELEISEGSSGLNFQDASFTWLAIDSGCRQEVQQGLSIGMPTHGLAMCLEPLIAWQLDSKSECSKKPRYSYETS